MDSLVQICVQLLFVISLLIHSSLSSESVHHHGRNESAGPLRCYQCNSGDGYDGPACDPDEIDEEFKSRYLHPCSTDDGLEYNHCRKIVQTVEGETRVVRSCATEGKGGDEDRCVDRVGTIRIKIKYCECYDNECNSAPEQNVIMTSLIVTSSILSVIAAVFKLL